MRYTDFLKIIMVMFICFIDISIVKASTESELSKINLEECTVFLGRPNIPKDDANIEDFEKYYGLSYLYTLNSAAGKKVQIERAKSIGLISDSNNEVILKNLQAEVEILLILVSGSMSESELISLIRKEDYITLIKPKLELIEHLMLFVDWKEMEQPNYKFFTKDNVFLDSQLGLDTNDKSRNIIVDKLSAFPELFKKTDEMATVSSARNCFYIYLRNLYILLEVNITNKWPQ